MKKMCDLPQELVVEILTRVPITSLKAVRSTCKRWEAITKSWVLGKKAAVPHEFVGFVRMNDKVYSLRYHLGGGEEEDLVVDVSVKQVDLLNQLEISDVYHCDGLVLCVATDHSKLVVWNPYLCQTRLIGPPRGGENFNEQDKYAIGYDSKRNHKILRFVDDYIDPGPRHVLTCEIYEISSGSWSFLKVKPKWEIDDHQRGVSVNGNTYFFAHQKYDDIEADFYGMVTEVEDFLLSFDFNKERFRRPLPLPFHSYNEDCVTLSSFVRDDDEQLAVLFGAVESDKFEIWVTLRVEPNYVSWRKFFLVETKPLFTALNFRLNSFFGFGGSFFVDEKNEVAVVFELDSYISIMAPPSQHMAFVFGQDGYIKSVNLGEALKLQYLSPRTRKHFIATFPPLVCSSSYRPSLVQVKQPRRLHKKKHMSLLRDK